MAETLAIRCLVSGRVQGVGYRAATVSEARAHGLDGWVRNLADGRVELAVAGAPGAVRSLIAWLWRGPPAAQVSGVSIEECAELPGPGFRILR